MWYFSVIDIIAILTDSSRPRKYWSDLKVKLISEGYIEVSEKIGQLKMQAPDGKLRETDAADSQTLLRIIQSIPSPKAEPFKRWLAEVERMKTLYEAKGYPQDWIEKRMRGIAIRNELTDEWDQRGAQEGIEYAILTNEIAHATFGLNIQDHKALKSLKRENLRDHMTDLELILTMLGEATSTALHRERDSQGLPDLKTDARDAGQIAGHTRKEIEEATGAPVVSPENYLDLSRREQLKQAINEEK